jgi:predicted membrane protein
VDTLVTDIIGMAGTGLVVLAYYLLQLDKVSSNSLSYNLMNLFGATFLLISLSFTFNLASFVIEVFWIGASFIGLWKIFRGRNGRHHPEERFG